MHDFADGMDSVFGGDDEKPAEIAVMSSVDGCVIAAKRDTADHWSGDDVARLNLKGECPHDGCLVLTLVDKDGDGIHVADYVQRSKLRIDGRVFFDRDIRLPRRTADKIAAVKVEPSGCDWMKK